MFCAKVTINNRKIKISSFSFSKWKKDHEDFLNNIFSDIDSNILLKLDNMDLFYLHFIEIKDFDNDKKFVRKNGTENYLRKLFNTEKYLFKEGDESFNMLPTIHMSNLDLFHPQVTSSTGIAIPRSIKYIDSSIWHYYVPIYKNEEDSNRETWKKNLRARIEYALLSIIDNKKSGLYNLSVTQEQADFYARILPQSYLADIGEHKKRISPFLFHSEIEMKELLKTAKDVSPHMPQISDMVAQKESVNNKKQQTKARWRILLVDDFSEKKMKTFPPGQNSLCKKDLIEKILKKMFVNYDDSIELLCASTVDNAVDVLKSKRIDLILLDYLLDYKHGGQREYGYELLVQIRDTDLKSYKGPLGKFWIFPITSFDEVFAQKLRERGWHNDSEDWFLAQGACPLDTPESFKYYLYKLMNRQLEGLEVQIVTNEPKEVHSLEEFLEEIFNEEERVREWTNKNFNALFAIKANYHKFKDDVRPVPKMELAKKNNMESVLVSSIFNKILVYEDEFWEHIIFMMYITAYPPSNQWFRLAHEYLCVKDKLSDGIGKKIEKYIYYIKNM